MTKNFSLFLNKFKVYLKFKVHNAKITFINNLK